MNKISDFLLWLSETPTVVKAYIIDNLYDMQPNQV